MQNKNGVTIIKRPKKIRKQRHSGAWKVAFADFMTAMMAFFMLMWILAVSDEDKLEGLAKFFTPATVPLSEMGGYDSTIDPEPDRNGETDESIRKNRESGDGDLTPEGEVMLDQERVRNASTNPWSALGEGGEDEEVDSASLPERMDEIKESIDAMLLEGESLSELAENVSVTRTEDGVELEIVDLGEAPMFRIGSAELTEEISRILAEVVPVIRGMPFRISVTGHTDANPYRGNGGYGNWELSIDRASATRREMARLGVDESRFVSVRGMAAVMPLLPEDPLDARNRRIAIDMRIPEAGSSGEEE